MKLKAKDLAAYRETQLMKQCWLDPVTHVKITAPALDHDHQSGHCRMVLQREVNAFEGKVFNAWRRYLRHLGVTLDAALEGLRWYHAQDFTQNPLHPKHRTPDEKRAHRNRKARLKRQKA